MILFEATSLLGTRGFHGGANVITDYIVDSRSVGTCQKVGEEVHHHQSFLLGLKIQKLVDIWIQYVFIHDVHSMYLV